MENKKNIFVCPDQIPGSTSQKLSILKQSRRLPLQQLFTNVSEESDTTTTTSITLSQQRKVSFSIGTQIKEFHDNTDGISEGWGSSYEELLKSDSTRSSESSTSGSELHGSLVPCQALCKTSQLEVNVVGCSERVLSGAQAGMQECPPQLIKKQEMSLQLITRQTKTCSVNNAALHVDPTSKSLAQKSLLVKVGGSNLISGRGSRSVQSSAEFQGAKSMSQTNFHQKNERDSSSESNRANMYHQGYSESSECYEQSHVIWPSVDAQGVRSSRSGGNGCKPSARQERHAPFISSSSMYSEGVYQMFGDCDTHDRQQTSPKKSLCEDKMAGNSVGVTVGPQKSFLFTGQDASHSQSTDVDHEADSIFFPLLCNVSRDGKLKTSAQIYGTGKCFADARGLFRDAQPEGVKVPQFWQQPAYAQNNVAEVNADGNLNCSNQDVSMELTDVLPLSQNLGPERFDDFKELAEPLHDANIRDGRDRSSVDENRSDQVSIICMELTEPLHNVNLIGRDRSSVDENRSDQVSNVCMELTEPLHSVNMRGSDRSPMDENRSDQVSNVCMELTEPLHSVNMRGRDRSFVDENRSNQVSNVCMELTEPLHNVNMRGRDRSFVDENRSNQVSNVCMELTEPLHNVNMRGRDRSFVDENRSDQISNVCMELTEPLHNVNMIGRDHSSVDENRSNQVSNVCMELTEPLHNVNMRGRDRSFVDENRSNQVSNVCMELTEPLHNVNMRGRDRSFVDENRSNQVSNVCMELTEPLHNVNMRGRDRSPLDENRSNQVSNVCMELTEPLHNVNMRGSNHSPVDENRSDQVSNVCMELTEPLHNVNMRGRDRSFVDENRSNQVSNVCMELTEPLHSVNMRGRDRSFVDENRSDQVSNVCMELTEPLHNVNMRGRDRSFVDENRSDQVSNVCMELTEPLHSVNIKSCQCSSVKEHRSDKSLACGSQEHFDLAVSNGSYKERMELTNMMGGLVVHGHTAEKIELCPVLGSDGVGECHVHTATASSIDHAGEPIPLANDSNRVSMELTDVVREIVDLSCDGAHCLSVCSPPATVSRNCRLASRGDHHASNSSSLPLSSTEQECDKHRLVESGDGLGEVTGEDNWEGKSCSKEKAEFLLVGSSSAADRQELIVDCARTSALLDCKNESGFARDKGILKRQTVDISSELPRKKFSPSPNTAIKKNGVPVESVCRDTVMQSSSCPAEVSSQARKSLELSAAWHVSQSDSNFEDDTSRLLAAKICIDGMERSAESSSMHGWAGRRAVSITATRPSSKDLDEQGATAADQTTKCCEVQGVEECSTRGSARALPGEQLADLTKTKCSASSVEHEFPSNGDVSSSNKARETSSPLDTKFTVRAGETDSETVGCIVSGGTADDLDDACNELCVKDEDDVAVRNIDVSKVLVAPEFSIDARCTPCGHEEKESSLAPSMFSNHGIDAREAGCTSDLLQLNSNCSSSEKICEVIHFEDRDSDSFEKFSKKEVVEKGFVALENKFSSEAGYDTDNVRCCGDETSHLLLVDEIRETVHESLNDARNLSQQSTTRGDVRHEEVLTLCVSQELQPCEGGNTDSGLQFLGAATLEEHSQLDMMQSGEYLLQESGHDGQTDMNVESRNIPPVVTGDSLSVHELSGINISISSEVLDMNEKSSKLGGTKDSMEVEYLQKQNYTICTTVHEDREASLDHPAVDVAELATEERGDASVCHSSVMEEFRMVDSLAQPDILTSGPPHCPSKETRHERPSVGKKRPYAHGDAKCASRTNLSAASEGGEGIAHFGPMNSTNSKINISNNSSSLSTACSPGSSQQSSAETTFSAVVTSLQQMFSKQSPSQKSVCSMKSMEDEEWVFYFLFETLKLVLKLASRQPGQPSQHKAVNSICLTSRIKEKNNLHMDLVHHIILKKFPLDMLKESCSTTEDVPNILKLLSAEMYSMIDFLLELDMLEKSGQICLKEKCATMRIAECDLMLLFDVSIDLSNWGSISGQDVFTKALIGSVREEDIKDLVLTVPQNPHFLSQYISAVEVYLHHLVVLGK